MQVLALLILKQMNQFKKNIQSLSHNKETARMQNGNEDSVIMLHVHGLTSTSLSISQEPNLLWRCIIFHSL